MRLHDLRHSCASRLAQAGVPLPTIGAALGHRCWQTTARYANHVPAGAVAEAMRKLDAPLVKPEAANG
jgi:integrase